MNIHQPNYDLAVRGVVEARDITRLSLDRFFRQPPFKPIYADPPWPYRPWRHGRAAGSPPYPTIPLEEIAALPVSRIAARDSVLLLWAPGPFLDKAMEVIAAWSFRFVTLGFVWIKTTGSGGPFYGAGLPHALQRRALPTCRQGQGVAPGKRVGAAGVYGAGGLPLREAGGD
jgi:hypothetical protein